MTTGGFHPGPFRTGGAASTNLELIVSSLNQSLGTAYAAYDLTRTDTAVWAENMAVGRAINDLWETNQRLTNQSDPERMSVHIPRWEKILGIVPNPKSSMATRKAAIKARFQLWSKPPTPQNVSDFLRLLLPDTFLRVHYNPPEDNEGSVPGGATVPGGVTLPEIVDTHGEPYWFSSVHNLFIQVWQPRDHDNNLLMSDADYYAQLITINNFLDSYLPSYMTFHTFRYVYDGGGVITTTAGSANVTGLFTSFTAQLEFEDTFESVDDNGNVQLYTVDHVVNNTSLVLTEPAPSNNTSGKWRILGFQVDIPQNLDNMVFGVI